MANITPQFATLFQGEGASPQGGLWPARSIGRSSRHRESMMDWFDSLFSGGDVAPLADPESGGGAGSYAAPLAAEMPTRSKKERYDAARMFDALGQEDRFSSGGGAATVSAHVLQTPAQMGIWDAFSGNLAYLRSAGVANKKTGGGDVDNLTRELTTLGNNGMKWGNKAMQNAGQISRMAPDLARYGVRSLNDLVPVSVPGYGTLYYNRTNNMVVPVDFGSSMHGEGGTYFTLQNVNGHVIPVTKWTDTSDKKSIMGGLSVLGMVAGLGGLGSALGSAMGTSAATGNAIVNAGMGALQGGVTGGLSGALKGGLMGGLGSVAGSSINSFNPGGMLTDNAAMASMINKGITGGLTGGLNAGLKGGDIGQGALSGLTAGGTSGLVSGLMGDSMGGMGSMLGGKAGSFLANQLFGGNQTPPQMPQQQRQVASNYQNPGMNRRQFNISQLGALQQQRVRGAFDKIKGYGYTGLDDVDLV